MMRPTFQRSTLAWDPPGQKSAQAMRALWIFFVTTISLAMALVVVFTDGNFLAAAALIGIVVIVTITIYRIDWGFYTFIFFVFLFDEFPVPGFPSVTADLGYFQNMSSISYLPSMSGAAATPMELHLVFLMFVWTLLLILRSEYRFTNVSPKGSLVFFTLAIISWLTRGLLSGGDFIIGLWEVRGFFYLATMIFLTPQIIRTVRQLQTIILVCIIGISFKALQGTIRYASLGFSFGMWPNIYETLTNHEDPVFFITLVMLLIGLSLYRHKSTQRTLLAWLCPLLMLGFVAAQRRATYASFAATLASFTLLLDKRARWRLIRGVLILSVFFGCYLGAFWNSGSRLAYPAQQFKATFTNEAGVRGEKDILSAFYRDQENYNLAYTFRTEPLIGRGFGMPFYTPVRLWTIDINKLGIYIPHNQLFWIFIKMGAVGGFIFWFFFNAFVFKSSMIFTRLADPYLKAICAICVVAVINQMVVSYVDMQLNFYRNMVYLGILMALPAILETLELRGRGRETPAPIEPTIVPSR